MCFIIQKMIGAEKLWPPSFTQLSFTQLSTSLQWDQAEGVLLAFIISGKSLLLQHGKVAESQSIYQRKHFDQQAPLSAGIKILGLQILSRGPFSHNGHTTWKGNSTLVLTFLVPSTCTFPLHPWATITNYRIQKVPCILELPTTW